MSRLQDWSRSRNLDKGHIARAIGQLNGCTTLTYREHEIADLCINYLGGIIDRWEICSPTSKREYLNKEESTNVQQ